MPLLMPSATTDEALLKTTFKTCESSVTLEQSFLDTARYHRLSNPIEQAASSQNRTLTEAFAAQTTKEQQ